MREKLTHCKLCQKEGVFFQSLGKTLEKRAHWRGMLNKLIVQKKRVEQLLAR